MADLPASDSTGRSSRRYPPVYERLVPLAMGLIAVGVVVLLLIILGVIFSWF